MAAVHALYSGPVAPRAVCATNTFANTLPNIFRGLVDRVPCLAGRLAPYAGQEAPPMNKALHNAECSQLCSPERGLNATLATCWSPGG